MDMDKVEQLKIELQHWWHQLENFIHQLPPTQICVAIGVVGFTIFFLLLIRLFKRPVSNAIVLTGLSGSGKTVLFYQLRDGSSHQGTVTSMEPNDGVFVLHSETTKKGKIKPVHLVDVPGHSRLRPKLDELLPRAAGIIFVVDAVEFLPNCRAASEYLYDVLTKASVVKEKTPVLILCNKVDKITAHTKEFIRKQLEKEIDKLRASRKAVSEADISDEFTLGVPGEAFSFTQCQSRVTVDEASGVKAEYFSWQRGHSVLPVKWSHKFNMYVECTLKMPPIPLSTACDQFRSCQVNKRIKVGDSKRGTHGRRQGPVQR